MDEETESLRGCVPAARLQLLAEIFSRNRPRLRRLVDLRLDARLRRRVDPSDVLQEAFLEAAERIDDYLAAPRLPLFLWLRLLTAQRVVQVHRHHLGVKGRDPRREVPLGGEPAPPVSSAALARRLVAIERGPAASGAAAASETRATLRKALDALEPEDRELLALRHFEELGNGEVACLLGITKQAASKRYFRALDRLRALLRGSPGAEGLEWP
jgi:RNA polymerase sigma-70 factor (ECF subfamily)